MNKNLKFKVTNCAAVNVRKSPSVNADNVVKILKYDTQVVAIKAGSNWYRIFENDIFVGYVMSKYLMEI